MMGLIGYSQGKETQWINVYRTDNGMVHGAPSATPGATKSIDNFFNTKCMSDTIDLSEIILASKIDFYFEIFLKELKEFTKSYDYKFDWDRDDGEEWGRILSEEDMVLIFNAKLLLVFIKKEYYSAYIDSIKFVAFNIQTVSIRNWKEKIYVISSLEAKDLVGWNSYQINTKFSINDLWFHTI